MVKKNAKYFSVCMVVLLACVVKGSFSVAYAEDIAIKALSGPLANEQIEWDQTPDTFGKQMIWKNLIQNNILTGPFTSQTYDTWENPTDDTGGEVYYEAGCVPVSLGQLMYYFKNYRYKDKLTALTSNSMDKTFVIGVDYPVKPSSSNDSGTIVMATINRTRSDDVYQWDEMVDSVYTNGVVDAAKKEKAQKYISPLLMDLGIATGVIYGLYTSYPSVTVGSTDTNFYDGASVLNDFGFEHAVSYGTSSNVLNNRLQFLNDRYTRFIKEIFETNLDYGNMVQFTAGVHANNVEGYGVTGGLFPEAINEKDARKEIETRFLINNGGRQHNWQFLDEYQNSDTNRITRLIFNVFPKIPQEISSLGKTPEIISGRVIPNQVFNNNQMFEEDLFIRATLMNLAPDGSSYQLGAVLPYAPVNKETGVYAIAVPCKSFIKLEVFESNNGTMQSRSDYAIRKEYAGLSYQLFDSLCYVGNVWGADFFPPFASVYSNSADDATATLTDHEISNQQITAAALSSSQSPLNDMEILMVAPDNVFSSIASNITNIVVNTLTFVLDGGTLISTGKSTLFPAYLGGVTLSPTFYSFSNTYHPYGNNTNIVATIRSPRILAKLGGVNTITLHSSSPQSEHQLINNPRNSTINATALYAVQQIVIPTIGDPYIDTIPVTSPVCIEFERGSNGGKVIYSNTEIKPNYDAEGIQKAFVEALLEPVFHLKDDITEIENEMGGEFYNGPALNSGSVVQDNLNMVVYKGGIEINNSTANEDTSFLFLIGDRRVTSIAPQINNSGDPELILDLYTPMGELYATHKALSGDHMISISVPAADNNEIGDWKYTIQEIHGFDGNRVVLASTIDGIYDMYDPDWTRDADTSDDAVIAAYTPKYVLHGVHANTYHHQLGDKKATVGDKSVNLINFGGLVNPAHVNVHRTGDDLHLEIKGTTDRVTVPDWFNSQRDLAVNFEHNGEFWTAQDIKDKAVYREAERIHHVISNDEYINGTDGNDNLSGRSSLNTMYLAGKGDDTVKFGGKGNILYYRKGDGNDVVTMSGDADSRAVINFHTDITSSDVLMSRVGDDMALFLPDSGSITIKNWFNGTDNKIDNINFYADSTVLDAYDIENLAAGKPLAERATAMLFDERFANDTNNNAADNSSDSGGCSTGALSIFSIAICLTLGLIGAYRKGKTNKGK